MLTPDWHCKSEPKEIFDLVRTEDIASLDAELPADRLRLVAADGAANYLRERIEAMDEETFAAFIDFHLKTCERKELLGASSHLTDILGR